MKHRWYCRSARDIQLHVSMSIAARFTDIHGGLLRPHPLQRMRRLRHCNVAGQGVWKCVHRYQANWFEHNSAIASKYILWFCVFATMAWPDELPTYCPFYVNRSHNQCWKIRNFIRAACYFAAPPIRCKWQFAFQLAATHQAKQSIWTLMRIIKATKMSKGSPHNCWRWVVAPDRRTLIE